MLHKGWSQQEMLCELYQQSRPLPKEHCKTALQLFWHLSPHDKRDQGVNEQDASNIRVKKRVSPQAYDDKGTATLPSKVLKIGTLNCQSLCNKTEGVVEHFKERDIDVLMLQETFLKPKDAAKIKELQDHGVCFLSCPRTCGRERGGFAVIFKPTL